MQEDGTYLLQYQADEAMDHETEWFYHLQHALARLSSLSQVNTDHLVACIIYQDENGELYDVCEFHDQTGYEFEIGRIDFYAPKLL